MIPVTALGTYFRLVSAPAGITAGEKQKSVPLRLRAPPGVEAKAHACSFFVFNKHLEH